VKSKCKVICLANYGLGEIINSTSYKFLYKARWTRKFCIQLSIVL